MIDINDLRHSISTALNLGRYTIVVKQVGGEPVPASITLDLVERDDDLFNTGCPEGSPAWDRWYKVASEDATRAALRPTITPEGDALRNTVTDDHGPAVPAQDWTQTPPEISYASPFFTGPRIYEFALQDAVYLGEGATLDSVGEVHAPDMEAAAAADWVHVYDRVTRERRTLKRPEPDAVLSGLRDVAADLRGKTVRAEMRTGEERYVERHMIDASQSGDPVMAAAFPGPLGAPVHSDPMPPVGPLTSTEGLKAGDVLFHADPDFGMVRHDGYVHSRTIGVQSIAVSGRGLSADFSEFAFVARPGVWMPWEGGECPVPGMTIRYELGGTRYVETTKANQMRWSHLYGGHHGDISAYMVVDTPPASSDT